MCQPPSSPTPTPAPAPGPSLPPAGASPGLKSPPQGPPRAAVDLPLTRAQAGSSETAVSEWFEEPGMRASFNLGGMTTQGRPATTQQGRLCRSCWEGASSTPPDRPALGPAVLPRARRPPAPPAPASAGRRTWGLVRTRGKPRAGASPPPPRPLSRAAQRAPGHVRAHVTAPRPAPARSPRAAVL